MNRSRFELNIVSPAYWRVTFDNPPINMLGAANMLELQDLVARTESDAEVKIVVFDSADPDFFVAHFDMAQNLPVANSSSPPSPPPWIEITFRLARAPVITVAAIRGRARGVGSEFALACDIRFASLEKAVFSQIEVGTGLIPGGGSVERLPLLTGRARALEIIAGCDDFDAATAERYGWINRAIPDAEFDTWIDRFARRVASFDKQALGTAKALINRHTLPDPADQLETQTLFYSAFAWPGYQERGPKLRARGLGERSEFEMNFGKRLGSL